MQHPSASKDHLPLCESGIFRSGSFLFFKQSLFQGNFTVKGWIKTVWKALYNDVSSIQFNELQARNKRDFSKNKNGHHRLGTQVGKELR